MTQLEPDAQVATPESATPEPAIPARGRPAWLQLTGVPLLLAVVVALIVVAFAWVGRYSSAKDVPVAIAGPPAAVAQLSQNLAKTGADTFEITTVSTADQAAELIRSREVLGAIVLGDQPQVLITTAGSSQVAGMLRQLAPTLQAQLQAAATAQGLPADQVAALVVTVTDVVPLGGHDTTGTGLTMAALPLVLGGMVGGVVLSMLVKPAGCRLAAASIYSVLGGIAVTLVMHTWFDLVPGNFWAISAVLAVSLAAMALPISGLYSLFGKRSLPFGPVLFVLFANPISGSSMPPQFLPGAWGAIGQAFPPGASGTLLRSVAYFPDAATSTQWLTLPAWILAGLVFAGLAIARQRPRSVVRSKPAS